MARRDVVKLTPAQTLLLADMAAGDELVWLQHPHWRWFLYDASEAVHGSAVRGLMARGFIALTADDDKNAVITADGRAAIGLDAASPASRSAQRDAPHGPETR